MQTITKQWICKTVEMEWLFLEQFKLAIKLTIKLANGACIDVQNFTF